jgi:hypothetical protein
MDMKNENNFLPANPPECVEFASLVIPIYPSNRNSLKIHEQAACLPSPLFFCVLAYKQSGSALHLLESCENEIMMKKSYHHLLFIHY